MGIKYGTICRIVGAFINRERPPRHQTIIYQDGVLYSYGRHYPLLKRYGEVLIGNSKSNSVTTNGHRSAIRLFFRLNPVYYFLELPDCDHTAVHDYYLDAINKIEGQARKSRTSNIGVTIMWLARLVDNYRQACSLLDVSPQTMKSPEEYVQWFLGSNPEIKSKYILGGMKR